MYIMYLIPVVMDKLGPFGPNVCLNASSAAPNKYPQSWKTIDFATDSDFGEHNCRLTDRQEINIICQEKKIADVHS